MTTQQLQHLIRAIPFRPFHIHMADGRAIFIPHPEMIAHAANGRIALVATSDDGFEVIDLLLVTALRVESTEAARS